MAIGCMHTVERRGAESDWTNSKWDESTAGKSISME
jgi:hypothetical protein